ncbi:MAG: TfoX/Sxy family protein [Rhodocyclales bacterium]|nr:TfoX/Sxy family protein [Rhodocyclales bacterium]
MAYDEGLAERIRDALRGRRGTSERRMFGGIAFMLDGNMAIGIVGDTLMARVGPARYEDALALPYVRPMDFTGKPMKGYVYVDPPGIEEDAALENWIAACSAFVSTLPPK